LFDYIDFSKNRPEFKAVHEWFKKQVITETKGVFTDLLEHDLGDVAKYAEMKVKKVKFKSSPSEKEIKDMKNLYPLGWLEETELKATETLKDENGNSVKEKYIDDKGREKERVVKVPKKSYHWCFSNIAETLNVSINGFRYDFGVGGIHGAKQGTHRSSDKRKLRTLDVASYYPNMAIANNVYPKHLGMTFCKVYKDLYEERKRHDKKSAANKALKLALNGTYGDSNNEFSPLYDPAYTMTITIGGQLSLCMLMGALIDHCHAEIIMCNTDGFEYFVDVEMIEKADKIVQRWEEVTGLEMEGDTYDVMYVADVNSYVAIKEDKDVSK
jgi:DNA polymerase elongation subunit (family B)